jgi:hypothetical protein
MQLPTILAVGALALTALGGAQGLAGLALQGVGTGVFTDFLGQTCPGSPFTVQIVYLPGDQAVLHSEVVATCPDVGLTTFLIGVALNTTQSPPLTISTFCQGNEATGLHCVAITAANQTLIADVGPSSGPLSTVTFESHATGAYNLTGTFTGV